IYLILDLRGESMSICGDIALNGVHRALADFIAVKVHARHAGMSGEGGELCFMSSKFASAEAVFLFCQNDNRSAFGSFVGEGRELRGVGYFRVRDARSGDEP